VALRLQGAAASCIAPPTLVTRARRAVRRAPLAPLLLLLLCCCAAPCRGDFTCAPADNAVTCDALGRLYGATAGWLWSGAAGWYDAANGKPTPFCRFAGITCDQSGAVTAMCVRAPRRAPAPAARRGLPRH
jgi:hypothetical protein